MATQCSALTVQSGEGREKEKREGGAEGGRERKRRERREERGERGERERRKRERERRILPEFSIQVTSNQKPPVSKCTILQSSGYK